MYRIVCVIALMRLRPAFAGVRRIALSRWRIVRRCGTEKYVLTAVRRRAGTQPKSDSIAHHAILRRLLGGTAPSDPAEERRIGQACRQRQPAAPVIVSLSAHHRAHASFSNLLPRSAAPVTLVSNQHTMQGFSSGAPYRIRL